MTLKSAFEDLSRTTLRAVSGCLGKLEYLARLRSRRGEYEHWGFGKVYGQTTANKVLADAHRNVVSEVLSTPLRALIEDVEVSSGELGLEPTDYLEGLTAQSKNLLPTDPGIGSARHLSSVLRALLGLERTRAKNATRRAS